MVAIPKQKRKKGERSKLVAKLIWTAKQIVYIRDESTCQRCGKLVNGLNRQASHVRPVSAGSPLRWDPLNMKVLCFFDHLHWWHKNPLEAAAWFQGKFPQRYAHIESHKENIKLSIPELQDDLVRLESELKTLQSVDGNDTMV